MTCVQRVGRNQSPKATCGDAKREGRGGDEERMDVHTDAATPKNEEFITWNENHRKEDQVCATKLLQMN